MFLGLIKNKYFVWIVNFLARHKMAAATVFMTPYDYVALVGYFVVIIGIGFWVKNVYLSHNNCILK